VQAKIAAILFGLAGHCLAQSVPSPSPTTISQTRFVIDTFNLTYYTLSDSATVSVGAVDAYGDGIGSLVTTAVLVKTPLTNDSIAWDYQPTRIDMLFHAKTSQPTRPAGISDFVLTLYADDGSSVHNPGVQVRF
jgi:hypothetical protein